MFSLFWIEIVQAHRWFDQTWLVLSAEIIFTRTSIRLVHRRMKPKLHNAITNVSFCVCRQWPAILSWCWE